MKTLLCTILVALGMSFSLSAQEYFLPGYVVSNSGDTTHCEIDYQNWKSGPWSIHVRLDGKVTRYSPLDISSFTVNDEYYHATIIKAKVNTRKALELRTDTVFVMTLVEGDKSLYYYHNESHYFVIRTERGFVPLINHRVKMTDGWTNKPVEKTVYKDTLRGYFAGNEKILDAIEKVDYTKRSLKALFWDYYFDRKEYPEYLNASFRSKASFGIIGGIKREKVQFNGSERYPQLRNSDFAAALSPELGFFILIPESRNFGRGAIYNEYTFTYFDTNGESENIVNERHMKLYQSTIRHMGLKVSLMARHRFSRVDGEGLFFQAGGTCSFLIHNNHEVVHQTLEGNYHRTERDGIEGFWPVGPRLGAVAGAGYLKSNFFLELRAEHSIDGGTFTKAYLLLGYSF